MQMQRNCNTVFGVSRFAVNGAGVKVTFNIVVWKMVSETCRRDNITPNFEKINVNPLSDNLFIFQKDKSTTLQEFSDKYATCLLRD